MLIFNNNYNSKFDLRDFNCINKTLIIDNVAENFSKQPDNGIFIKTWHNDMEDTCLTDLIPLLKQLVEDKVEDVGKALKNYRDQIIRMITEGVQNPDIALLKNNDR